MRIPLEYGDNFPVLPGSWNPAVPWRFPRQRSFRSRPVILPWITLGLGIVLGVLWMSRRVETGPPPSAASVEPAPAPSDRLPGLKDAHGMGASRRA